MGFDARLAGRRDGQFTVGDQGAPGPLLGGHAAGGHAQVASGLQAAFALEDHAARSIHGGRLDTGHRHHAVAQGDVAAATAQARGHDVQDRLARRWRHRTALGRVAQVDLTGGQGGRSGARHHPDLRRVHRQGLRRGLAQLRVVVQVHRAEAAQCQGRSLGQLCRQRVRQHQRLRACAGRGVGAAHHDAIGRQRDALGRHGAACIHAAHHLGGVRGFSVDGAATQGQTLSKQKVAGHTGHIGADGAGVFIAADAQHGAVTAERQRGRCIGQGAGIDLHTILQRHRVGRSKDQVTGLQGLILAVLDRLIDGDGAGADLGVHLAACIGRLAHAAQQDAVGPGLVELLIAQVERIRAGCARLPHVDLAGSDVQLATARASGVRETGIAIQQQVIGQDGQASRVGRQPGHGGARGLGLVSEEAV